MVVLYGIKNCDTVRKARRWLEAAGVDHAFRDFRKDGLAATDLDRWAAAVGWETLLNRRGTTWRQLDADLREGIDADRARQLMLEQPTLIKRPVLEHGGTVLVGFSEAAFSRLLRPAVGE